MTITPRFTVLIDQVKTYCQKWGIREFALFGSILRDDLSDTSDIDVLVTFAESAQPTLFSLVEMTDDLETLLGRKVDIVTRASVEASDNYIRRREVLSTAKVIYGT